MNSLLKKYLISLLICGVFANLTMIIKVEVITKDILIGVNLFYIIPITLLYLIFLLCRVAVGKSPS